LRKCHTHPETILYWDNLKQQVCQWCTSKNVSLDDLIAGRDMIDKDMRGSSNVNYIWWKFDKVVAADVEEFANFYPKILKTQPQQQPLPILYDLKRSIQYPSGQPVIQ
jgi:hypothetical protein